MTLSLECTYIAPAATLGIDECILRLFVPFVQMSHRGKTPQWFSQDHTGRSYATRKQWSSLYFNHWTHLSFNNLKIKKEERGKCIFIWARLKRLADHGFQRKCLSCIKSCSAKNCRWNVHWKHGPRGILSSQRHNNILLGPIVTISHSEQELSRN